MAETPSATPVAAVPNPAVTTTTPPAPAPVAPPAPVPIVPETPMPVIMAPSAIQTQWMEAHAKTLAAKKALKSADDALRAAQQEFNQAQHEEASASAALDKSMNN